MSWHWCFLRTDALNNFFSLVFWCFLLKGFQQRLEVSAAHRGCITATDALAGRKGRLFTAGLKVSGQTHRKGRCVGSVSCDLGELKGLEESVPSHRTVAFMGSHVLENPRKKEKCITLCSWSSGLWRDQRSILTQAALGSETH